MIETLVGIIEEYTGRQDVSVTRDTLLLGDLGLNSFDLVQLVCKVEDAFDVSIPDKIIGKLKTVGDVIDFIENQ